MKIETYSLFILFERSYFYFYFYFIVTLSNWGRVCVVGSTCPVWKDILDGKVTVSFPKPQLAYVHTGRYLLHKATRNHSIAWVGSQVGRQSILCKQALRALSPVHLADLAYLVSQSVHLTPL